jgi:hypothetical protein
MQSSPPRNDKRARTRCSSESALAAAMKLFMAAFSLVGISVSANSLFRHLSKYTIKRQSSGKFYENGLR